jgi:hypothetical protein
MIAVFSLSWHNSLIFSIVLPRQGACASFVKLSVLIWSIARGIGRCVAGVIVLESIVAEPLLQLLHQGSLARARYAMSADDGWLGLFKDFGGVFVARCHGRILDEVQRKGEGSEVAGN